jgi:hypothetical protein
MVNAQVAQDTWLHLVDSGSSMFTSPHKDTLILPIKTTLKLTDVGGANSELMSPLVYTVLDTDGAYVSLYYQAVYYLPSVPISLFVTGPFEQQGWVFHFNAQAPYMTKDGTCVPFFKDRMTGFHWLVERTHANPTILGRQGAGQTALEAAQYGRGGFVVYTRVGFFGTAHLTLRGGA